MTVNDGQRYNVKIGAFNAELRKALTFVKDTDGASAYTVASKLGWTESKGKRAMLALLSKGLVRVLPEKEQVGRGKRHRYAAEFHTETTIDRALPTDLQTALRFGYITFGSQTSVRNITRRELKHSDYEDGKATRDPLDTLLMGTGEAPSLAFRRQHGDQATN